MFQQETAIKSHDEFLAEYASERGRFFEQIEDIVSEFGGFEGNPPWKIPTAQLFNNVDQGDLTFGKLPDEVDVFIGGSSKDSHNWLFEILFESDGNFRHLSLNEPFNTALEPNNFRLGQIRVYNKLLKNLDSFLTLAKYSSI